MEFESINEWNDVLSKPFNKDYQEIMSNWMFELDSDLLFGKNKKKYLDDLFDKIQKAYFE